MAIKPSDTYTLATDGVFDGSAPAPGPGEPTKVPPGSFAQGMVPGTAVSAQQANYLWNISGQWITWLNSGSSLNGDNPRIVETDGNGSTFITNLSYHPFGDVTYTPVTLGPLASTIYGTGFDGDFTNNGTLNLTRDVYYKELINNGTIYTHGFKIFCSERLRNTGFIRNTGFLSDAPTEGSLSGGSAGGVGGAPSNPGQAAQDTNGYPSTSLAPFGFGGDGGEGLGGTSGGFGGGAQKPPDNSGAFTNLANILSGAVHGVGGTFIMSGGAGGGGGAGGNVGGAFGGNGGNGGGTILISARVFDNLGGTIMTDGQHGDNGSSGGGGGGGGGGAGALIVLTQNLVNQGFWSINGGIGGAGVDGGQDGNNGFDGFISWIES